MNICFWTPELKLCDMLIASIKALIGEYSPKLVYSILAFSEEKVFEAYLSHNSPHIVYFCVSGDHNNWIITVAKKLRQINPHCHMIFVSPEGKFYPELISLETRPSGYFLDYDQDKLLSLLVSIFESEIKNNLKLYIFSNYKELLIDQRNILYIYRNSRKTNIVTIDEIVKTNQSLTKLKNSLGSYFLFNDKSSIVNIDYIKSIDLKRDIIYLLNGHQIPLARNRKAELKKRLAQELKIKRLIIENDQC